jgi:hypothetical protein
MLQRLNRYLNNFSSKTLKTTKLSQSLDIIKLESIKMERYYACMSNTSSKVSFWGSYDLSSLIDYTELSVTTKTFLHHLIL